MRITKYVHTSAIFGWQGPCVGNYVVSPTTLPIEATYLGPNSLLDGVGCHRFAY